MLTVRHHLPSSIPVIVVFFLRVSIILGKDCALGYTKSSTGSCYRLIQTYKDFCSAASHCLLDESRRLKHQVSLPVGDITGLLADFRLPLQSWVGAFTVEAHLIHPSVQLIFPRAHGTPLPDHILKQLPSPLIVGQCLAAVDSVTFRLVDCGAQLPFLCEYDPGVHEEGSEATGKDVTKPSCLNVRFDKHYPLSVADSTDSAEAHISCLQQKAGQASRYSCAAEPPSKPVSCLMLEWAHWLPGPVNPSSRATARPGPVNSHQRVRRSHRCLPPSQRASHSTQNTHWADGMVWYIAERWVSTVSMASMTMAFSYPRTAPSDPYQHLLLPDAATGDLEAPPGRDTGTCCILPSPGGETSKTCW
ncbi:unnamed protein product [Schistocephalus solidus]|uniref:Secreted protein n=1 Tax=Schistocephalus solidus TaxID=70667 RepID=A0A183T183_SCHSO|nr:unnamed protein product [Schistocephalus solidus]